jgi:hypothetical protein
MVAECSWAYLCSLHALCFNLSWGGLSLQQEVPVALGEPKGGVLLRKALYSNHKRKIYRSFSLVKSSSALTHRHIANNPFGHAQPRVCYVWKTPVGFLETLG